MTPPSERPTPMPVPLAVRGPVVAFVFASVYGVLFGLPLTLTGLFAGPIPLTAGVLHVAIGAASAVVAGGLVSGLPGARTTALVLSAAIALAGAAAVIGAAISREWPAASAAIPTLLFGAVFASLFRRRRDA